MRHAIKTFYFILLISLILKSITYAADDENIGDDIRLSDCIVHGDLLVKSISKEKLISGKLKAIETLKGKMENSELDINITLGAPQNSFRLNSDLTNLNISASEGIEQKGSSNQTVVAMLRKTPLTPTLSPKGEGVKNNGEYEIVRLVPLFRPDKLKLYIDSYKEVIKMTEISDEKKLLKTIKYNLAEEFSYTLYNYCIDELFRLNISFEELFSTVKEFLIYKGNRKVYSWFVILKRSGERLDRDYDKAGKGAKDNFFSYLHDSYKDEPIESDYTNKLFLELLIDSKGLIIKNDVWKKKIYELVKSKPLTIENVGDDNFRSKKLEELQKKVLHSLSKE